jgi:hypothetical protein
MKKRKYQSMHSFINRYIQKEISSSQTGRMKVFAAALLMSAAALLLSA